MKTISHVYDTYGQARAAVQSLEASGIASRDISMVANKYVSERYAHLDEVSSTGAGAGVGAVAGGSAGLLAGLGLVAIPGLGPVVAAGWIAATAVGAAAGAVAGATVGGLVGVLQEAGEPEVRAHVYSEAVRRGATLVTAKVADVDAARVRNILEEHEPIDPQRREREFRAEGWERFDPAAPPYRPSEGEIERIRMKGYL